MIKVHFDGMVFEADSAAEAAELHRQLKGTAGPKHAAKPQETWQIGRTIEQLRAVHAVQKQPQDAPVFSEWVQTSALGFLTAIRNAAPKSPDAATMIRAVGAESAKGFGGRTAQVNRLLDHLGFDQNSVYGTTKNGKQRYWIAGKKLDDAIRAVEKRINAANNP